MLLLFLKPQLLLRLFRGWLLTASVGPPSEGSRACSRLQSISHHLRPAITRRLSRLCLHCRCCGRCCCRCCAWLLCHVLPGTHIRHVPQGPIRPTVWSSSFHHQHFSLSTHQYVAGGGPRNSFYFQDNVAGSDPCFSVYTRYFFHFSILCTKAPILSSVMSTGTPYTVIFVLRVPMYSVCRQSVFDVNTLPGNFLASCSVINSISLIDLELLDNIFGPIFKLLRASSMVSLLIPITF